MVTPAGEGGHRCTDCGKPMDSAGTCNECLLAHQEAGRKIRADLAKVKEKNRGRK